MIGKRLAASMSRVTSQFTPGGGVPSASERAATPEPEALLQREIGSYRLVDVIGRGGMGTVYLAEHRRLSRRVAVKLLRGEHAKRRGAVARFFQEAESVNRIRHRNIVDITDFVELEDGTAFIVMELLEGKSLHQLRRSEGPLGLALVLDIVLQVCAALEAAHAVGVIHRDLKPDNVFVCNGREGNDWVKLLDFGVAKLRADPGTELATLSPVERTTPADLRVHTNVGQIIGTPGYMSPEQARGEHVDERSDIFGLGAIMFELLCHQRLSRAQAHREIMADHGVPPGLAEVILRCVDQRPEQRFPSAWALRVQLTAIRASLAEPQPRPRRHRRWVAVLGGACAVVIAAALVAPHLTDSDRARSEPTSPHAVPSEVAPASTPPSTAASEPAAASAIDPVATSARPDAGVVVTVSAQQTTASKAARQSRTTKQRRPRKRKRAKRNQPKKPSKSIVVQGEPDKPAEKPTVVPAQPESRRPPAKKKTTPRMTPATTLNPFN
ncbi:MAG: serine/threonine protein kinase [Proteobacteria bacterium]|nr:serine/threonine protein kinase [Pseudomonadota bacterium]